MNENEISSSSQMERRKTKRRQEILNAAESLFLKNSFDNNTMDQIALQTDLSKETLHKM